MQSITVHKTPSDKMELQFEDDVRFLPSWPRHLFVSQFCVEDCHTEDRKTLCRTICATDSIPDLKLVPDVKEWCLVWYDEVDLLIFISVLQSDDEHVRLRPQSADPVSVAHHRSVHHIQAGEDLDILLKQFTFVDQNTPD